MYMWVYSGEKKVCNDDDKKSEHERNYIVDIICSALLCISSLFYSAVTFLRYDICFLLSYLCFIASSVIM